MNRWDLKLSTPFPASSEDDDHSPDHYVGTGRIRNTQSDYVTGGHRSNDILQRSVSGKEYGAGWRARRKRNRERERETLERHMDTFSDQLELVEPTTLWGRFVQSLRRGGVLYPQSYWHLGWQLLVSACFAYNCVVIPLRSTFPYQTPMNRFAWMMCDLAADCAYLLDLVLVKPHVIFLYDGFWVRDKRLTRRHYFAKWQFKWDILSLAPLDLLHFVYGPDLVIFRLPRVLKIQTFWELFEHLDSLLMSPYLVRVARTLFYMLFLVHLNACAYYAFSAREGLGTNNWTFAGGDGNAYIRCFYFATKTATSVGKNPRPETIGEYLFMTCSWLMGVFVFALLIGQIRDIVATASRTKTEYRRRLDETLEHMRRLSLPEAVQMRVQSWFTFTTQHQPFDEAKILNSLPQKLKTDVAIDVHGVTLSKVQLFQKIADQALIRELVLKLRSVLYLPGDYICRKDEIGKEMYIVKTGQVEVLDPTGGEVLATLAEGSVFGEISLLALAGGNRRTADVRSKGFSNLFVLSKNDLHETLVYYPDAQQILKEKAEELVRENEERARRERANRMSPSSSEDCLDSSSEGSSADPPDTEMRPSVTIGVTVSATPSPPNVTPPNVTPPNDSPPPEVATELEVHSAPIEPDAYNEQDAEEDQGFDDTIFVDVDPELCSGEAEASGCLQTHDAEPSIAGVDADLAEPTSNTTLTTVTHRSSCVSIASTSSASDPLSSARLPISTCSPSCSASPGASPGASPCHSPSGEAVKDDSAGSGDTLSDLSTASIMSPPPCHGHGPEWWRRPSLRSELHAHAHTSGCDQSGLHRRRVSAPNPRVRAAPAPGHSGHVPAAAAGAGARSGAASPSSDTACHEPRTDPSSGEQRKRSKPRRIETHSSP